MSKEAVCPFCEDKNHPYKVKPVMKFFYHGINSEKEITNYEDAIYVCSNSHLFGASSFFSLSEEESYEWAIPDDVMSY
jgi:hypothetical protein